MNYSVRQCSFCYLVVVFILMGCSDDDNKKFRLVPADESGISFRNDLNETADFNILNYLYFYNGGGVAVGDLNGDSLPDVYFTANQLPNKLYLNLGGLKFKDITDNAGVAGFNGWATGVTLADVNDDGRLDIYVSYLGDFRIYKGRNQLFINEGNDESGSPIFSDQALEFGLDLVGFSTQASFFDYDRDGDLDMFMLTHSTHNNGTYGKATLRKTSHPLAGDRLLRNDNGRFVDVTRGSGIYNSVIGYGLGMVVSDINLDGWPDIYVGNDFHENDYLYLNMGDGTFQEVLESQMQHTSRYTMGVDLADFNNDGFPDLLAMDMLPADPVSLKSAVAEDPYDIYNFKINFGYNHQFARNTLQLNNQDGTFSEIALFAGVAATDWSWSCLFADFDLNGSKDIFVTNGIRRRLNDLDYINFMQTDSMRAKMNNPVSDRELIYIEKMPKVKISNYLFINNNDSTFTNKAADWGLDMKSYSNGAAYADLDNDGDLDLVVNNIDQEAFVYENLTIDQATAESPHNHYIQFLLEGRPGNRFGIGTKVFLYEAGRVQVQELLPARGYLSSVDFRLTFGLGNSTDVDSVVVVWNDGLTQTLKGVRADQRIKLQYQNAAGQFQYASLHKTRPLFQTTTDFTIAFEHKENRFNEFTREQLIPHMMSSEGPAAAVGDLNADGRDDLFIGGAKWQPAGLFVQNESGALLPFVQPALMSDSAYEDTDAVFFDADGDDHTDLLVLSGGNEFSGTSEYRKPRLYINDGRGGLTKSTGIPNVFLVGSCIAISDVDNDGDIDIFLGARTTTWRYGIKPDSYLLLNDGRGNFTNATVDCAPGLLKFGFVKSATWADIDNDKDDDLVIAAEWSPITIFLNEGGKLALLRPEESGLAKSNGWWNVISAIDYDADGDSDFIAGNMGLNSKLRASATQPVRMFVGDFDNNDSTDQILTHFMMGKEYPFHTRDEMTKQMPYLKKRFLSYQKFAETDLHGMFSESALNGAIQYEAYTFETSVIENLGNRKFKVTPLPASAQFSTVNAIMTNDFDGDGKQDLLLAGNFYPVNIQLGRYDAGFGLFLKGDGNGHFQPYSAVKSGLCIKDETKKLRAITVGDKTYYLAIKNNGAPEAFMLSPR